MQQPQQRSHLGVCCCNFPNSRAHFFMLRCLWPVLGISVRGRCCMLLRCHCCRVQDGYHHAFHHDDDHHPCNNHHTTGADIRAPEHAPSRHSCAMWGPLLPTHSHQCMHSCHRLPARISHHPAANYHQKHHMWFFGLLLRVCRFSESGVRFHFRLRRAQFPPSLMPATCSFPYRQH